MITHLMEETESVENDAEFDLVVGEIEADIPEHKATSMQSPMVPATCLQIYCH